MTNPAISKEEILTFIDLAFQKIDELANSLGNLRNILTQDDGAGIPEAPAVPKEDAAREKRIAECKEKVKKYILKLDKREKGVKILYMRRTELTRNNQTGKLEPVMAEYDHRFAMKSYRRRKDRYRKTDPDEIVRNKLDFFIVDTFAWFFEEPKQHRIDINWPIKGQVTIEVR